MINDFEKHDWDFKFTSLLICEEKELVDCKNVPTVYCLKCRGYYCEEHYYTHVTRCIIKEGEYTQRNDL